jgi:hypothetical protein
VIVHVSMVMTIICSVAIGLKNNKADGILSVFHIPPPPHWIVPYQHEWYGWRLDKNGWWLKWAWAGQASARSISADPITKEIDKWKGGV